MKLPLIALALMLGLSGCARANPPITHAATLRLDFTDGTCSGTAVATHVVLTAEHCVVHGALVAINGELAFTVGKPILDGSDHALITVTAGFAKVATLGGGMYQTQRVHWWGNPAGIADLFRRGYISGQTEGWMLVDGMGFNGDSGAALFDDNGRIVGVVSTLMVEHSFHLMGAKPLAFSAKQLKAAGI